MTGRKGRVVSTDDGNVQYESRSESDTPLELLNLAEKQRFMNGEKVGGISNYPLHVPVMCVVYSVLHFSYDSFAKN